MNWRGGKLREGAESETLHSIVGSGRRGNTGTCDILRVEYRCIGVSPRNMPLSHKIA
jgi:hypothetical protein